MGWPGGLNALGTPHKLGASPTTGCSWRPQLSTEATWVLSVPGSDRQHSRHLRTRAKIQKPQTHTVAPGILLTEAGGGGGGSSPSLRMLKFAVPERVGTFPMKVALFWVPSVPWAPLQGPQPVLGKGPNTFLEQEPSQNQVLPGHF